MFGRKKKLKNGISTKQAEMIDAIAIQSQLMAREQQKMVDEIFKRQVKRGVIV